MFYADIQQCSLVAANQTIIIIHQNYLICQYLFVSFARLTLTFIAIFGQKSTAEGKITLCGKSYRQKTSQYMGHSVLTLCIITGIQFTGSPMPCIFLAISAAFSYSSSRSPYSVNRASGNSLCRLLHRKE